MFDRRHLLSSAAALTAFGTSEVFAKTKAKSSKPATKTNAPKSDAAEAAKLTTAFDQSFEGLLDLSPSLCTALGVDTGKRAMQKSKLDHVSPTDQARYVTFLKGGIAALGAIDRSKLQGMDRINYDTVLWDANNSYKGATSFDLRASAGAPYVLSQLTGSYQSTPDFIDSQHSISTKDDAEAYLSRLNEFAAILGEESENMAFDVAKGITPPDFVITKALVQLKSLLGTKDSDLSLIQSVARRARQAKLDGNWEERAASIVNSAIKPALEKQIKALEALAPTAVHDAGIWRLPQGEAMYAYAARSGTTTDLSPDEIHKIGLDKVAEITAKIDEITRKNGLTKGTPAQRMSEMGKDKRFLYPNTDAGKEKLLADLNKQIAVVFAKAPKFFGVLPKSKVTVKRVPKATEAGAPGGYYNAASLDGKRPGAYYINLRDTAENPSWSLPTLTYHEAVPGHHFQISIQQEAKGLPMLRKISGFNAYIEGWALYSEQVADEDMDMYAKDPWGKVGYLHDALFRAIRLVVDTGMHHKRWSREQAIAYMVDYTGDPEASAVTEIERYCVWPGQALGYMVGKIQWLRLRAMMQAKQGKAFDIRQFHDTGLLAGAVPLSVLEQVYRDAGLI